MTNLTAIRGFDYGEITIYKDDDYNTYFCTIENTGSVETCDRKYYNVYRQVNVWKDGDITFGEKTLHHDDVRLLGRQV